ncbi:hypothetical protein NUSPORA_01668 [Nucleospora cyclopteri]
MKSILVKNEISTIVELPVNLQQFIQTSKKLREELDKINFIYKTTEGEEIKIKQGEKQLKIAIIKYEDIQQEKEECFLYNKFGKNYKLIFIFYKLKYLNDKKREQIREYKKAVQNGESIVEMPSIDLQSLINNFQIETNTNICYIENSDDLYVQLNSVVYAISTTEEFKPKIRKFPGESKKQFLAHLLSGIPGISVDVANSISNEYNSVFELYKKMEEDLFVHELASTKIIINEKFQRFLGEKKATKIYEYFKKVE